MKGTISALLPGGRGQPAPSSLTTPDEVGTIYPSSPLSFLGGDTAGFGFVNYLQGQSRRSAPHAAQGKDAEKKSPPCFLWSWYCPHQVQKLLLPGGASLHTSRERGIMLTLTPLSFCTRPNYSKYLCALQLRQRFHPHPIHFTQEFFFSLRRGEKKSKQNGVCKPGGGGRGG